MLIEEGVLLPESLRFESELWTAFCTSGEIIRELRMTLENKPVNVPRTKNAMEEGGLKYDQLQRLSPTEALNRWRPLLPDNAPR
jgi:hypothetical protein